MTDRAREDIARLLNDAGHWIAADDIRAGRSVLDTTRYIAEDPRFAMRLRVHRAIDFVHASAR